MESSNKTTEATEVLKRAIEEALNFTPEEQEEGEQAWEDTWLGHFGSGFSGVVFLYNSIKNVSKNRGYRGPKFTLEQENHIESVIREINEALNTQREVCSIRKPSGQKDAHKPTEDQQTLIVKLRSMVEF